MPDANLVLTRGHPAIGAVVADDLECRVARWWRTVSRASSRADARSSTVLPALRLSRVRLWFLVLCAVIVSEVGVNDRRGTRGRPLALYSIAYGDHYSDINRRRAVKQLHKVNTVRSLTIAAPFGMID